VFVAVVVMKCGLPSVLAAPAARSRGVRRARTVLNTAIISSQANGYNGCRGSRGLQTDDCPTATAASCEMTPAASRSASELMMPDGRVSARSMTDQQMEHLNCARMSV
jgi:hypothetical protein